MRPSKASARLEISFTCRGLATITRCPRPAAVRLPRANAVPPHDHARVKNLVIPLRVVRAVDCSVVPSTRSKQISLVFVAESHPIVSRLLSSLKVPIAGQFPFVIRC